MEKYGWTYQELLDTPKVVFDWVVELMDFDAQKQKNDNAEIERKTKG